MLARSLLLNCSVFPNSLGVFSGDTREQSNSRETRPISLSSTRKKSVVVVKRGGADPVVLFIGYSILYVALSGLW